MTGKRQGATINRQAGKEDSSGVMFLPVFLHWIYIMKYGCYHNSLLFLAGLFIGLWLRNAPLDQKKSEIIIFKNKLLLVSDFTLLDYAKSKKSLNNYIAFDVFFFLVSCLCSHFMHICKI